MYSTYEILETQLATIKCTTCYGSGKCNDAGPGDIMYTEWVCKSCNGNGFKNANEYTLEELHSE